MKVLRTVYEIPLGEKTAAQDLARAAKLVADFSTKLAEEGFAPVGRTEILVTRSKVA